MGAQDQLPQEVLIPVEQAIVPFYGHELVAVRLSDGRIAAVIRWLCEGMQLDFNAQLQRIRRKTALRDDLVTVRVETAGGPQAMPALALHGLPGWLYTIDETRVSESARPAVILFQREATDALAEHFTRRQPQLTAPANLVPAEPIAKPESPGVGAPLEAWRAYHEAMLAWIDWQRDVESWRGRVESRLESHEEVLRLVPEILDRLGPATLSPEHQSSVQTGVNRLHDLTGRPHAAIHNELRQAFHVGTYKDIPEARWGEVAVWFRERIARAQGTTNAPPPEQGSLF